MIAAGGGDDSGVCMEKERDGVVRATGRVGVMAVVMGVCMWKVCDRVRLGKGLWKARGVAWKWCSYLDDGASEGSGEGSRGCERNKRNGLANGCGRVRN